MSDPPNWKPGMPWPPPAAIGEYVRCDPGLYGVIEGEGVLCPKSLAIDCWLVRVDCGHEAGQLIPAPKDDCKVLGYG